MMAKPSNSGPIVDRDLYERACEDEMDDVRELVRDVMERRRDQMQYSVEELVKIKDISLSGRGPTQIVAQRESA